MAEDKKEMKRIALVTGANKGIGFETVKRLCGHKNLHVILGSRTAGNAEKAANALKKDGITNFSLLQIDIDDEKSITEAAATVKKNHGGLDILINNAGMAWKGSAFNEEVARTTINTNYYGTIRVSNAFFPLLNENARVVNISSGTAPSGLRKMSAPLRQQFFSR